MDLKCTECEGVDWIHLAKQRVECRGLVNMVINSRVPQKLGKLLTI
jgi:hypothetical protein